MVDNLYYHAESDCYVISIRHPAIEHPYDPDAQLCELVSGYPEHEKIFEEREKLRKSKMSDLSSGWTTDTSVAIDAAISNIAEQVREEQKVGSTTSKSTAGRRKKGESSPKAEKKVKGHPFKEAFDFLGLAQNTKGSPHERAIQVHDNFAMSTDGILTLGCALEISASFNPDFEHLKKIPSKYWENFTVSVSTESTSLFVSGDFKCNIPCVPQNQWPSLVPDPGTWGPLNETILTGFKKLNAMVGNNPEHANEHCIRLSSNIMSVVRKTAIEQYCHGWAMPQDFSIPKQALKAILKCGKALHGLGFSEHSVTFYFTDGAWLKTQVYTEAYPEIDSVFNYDAGQCLIPYSPIPSKFFIILEEIKPWLKDGIFFIREGCLSSYPNEADGTHIKVEGLPYNWETILDYNYISLANSPEYTNYYVTNIGVFFTGEKSRMAIRPTPINEINI